MAEQFGPYRLDHLIGRGGMGEVHRAYDTVRNRTVALKRLPATLADDPEFQARFRRESAIAAQLSEPHIIPIHDFGEIDGQLYIDMRLVEGVDLASVLAQHGPMAPRRAVGILAQVAAALDAAHGTGLVHRDIKPSNVLVSGDDEDEFAYLIDFGIARSTAGTTAGPSLTAVGSAIGTLDYMAPERFGNDPADGRADVYSLACMLFELLIGHPPYHGMSAAALIHAHLAVDAPRPSAHRAGLPPGLDAVVLRGMAKDPAHRYPSAGALVAAARVALRLQTPAGQPAPPAPAAGPAPTRQSTAPPGLPQTRQGTSPPFPQPTPQPTLYPAQQPVLHPAPQPVAQVPPQWPAHQPYAAHAWPAAAYGAHYPTPPASSPPRPGGLVLALVLQVIAAVVALTGGVAGLAIASTLPDGASTAGIVLGLMVLPVLYLVLAIVTYVGRGWARWPITVMHSILTVFWVFSLAAGLPESTEAEAVTGALIGFVIVTGYTVAATVPMFTVRAREYFAATRYARSLR